MSKREHSTGEVIELDMEEQFFQLQIRSFFDGQITKEELTQHIPSYYLHPIDKLLRKIRLVFQQNRQIESSFK